MLVGALLILLVPFADAVDTFFVSDDIQMLLFGATTEAHEIAWLPSSRWTWHRPLPAFSWILNYAVSGADVRGWHLPNVALHGLNVVLAFVLAQRLSGSRPMAALTAVLFAWSPVTPGTVNWISARPDLLSTSFTLAALYVAYPTTGERWHLAHAVGVSLLVMLAMSSKESAFALLPIAIALYAVPRLLRTDRRWYAHPALPLLVVLILGSFLVARFALYGATLGGYGAPLSVRRLVSAPLLAAPSLLAPVRLILGLGAHGLASLAVGGVVTAWLLRQAPIWTVCALCAVLPAAHLIAASNPLWEYDRFYYLASFWMAGALATSLVALHARGFVRAAAIATALLLLTDVVYLTQRLHGLERAAGITQHVDNTLRLARQRREVQPGSVIWCGNLPDSLAAAYAYRNGCEEHVRLVWPDGDVTGQRTPLDTTASEPVFALSADGRTLSRR